MNPTSHDATSTEPSNRPLYLWDVAWLMFGLTYGFYGVLEITRGNNPGWVGVVFGTAMILFGTVMFGDLYVNAIRNTIHRAKRHT